MMHDHDENALSPELFAPADSIQALEDAAQGSGLSFWQDTARRLRSNKTACICMASVVILVAGSIIFPQISGYTVSEQDLLNINLGFFSEGHLFGTDEIGRDMFTRVWYGTGISLTIAFSAVLIDLLIGAVYGGISGYTGGRVDEMMMRIVDIIIGIPQLIIVILLMVVMKPGIATIIIAYSTVGWTGMARLVRGQVLKLRGSEYVLASRLLGASPARIIARDLLPNTLGIIIVELTLTIPSAIFTEAFLSYIGLGVQIPLASLGTLASDGASGFLLHPHLLMVPTVFLSATMLTFNLLGDALRDILDPRMRS